MGDETSPHEVSALDSIVKVQSALDVLRMHGKTASLVLMPDLYLLDSEHEHVDRAAGRTKGDRVGRPFEGHVGIATAALAGLRVRDEQVFKLWPVAKVGAVGREAFCELLRQLSRDLFCEDVRTDFILSPSDAEDRHTWVEETDTEPDRIVQPLKPSMELRLQDLKDSFVDPFHVLRSCTTLGFLSMEYEAITGVLADKSIDRKPRPLVFVDTGCYEESQTDTDCLHRLADLGDRVDYASFSGQDAAAYANLLLTEQGSDQFDASELSAQDAYRAAMILSEALACRVVLHHKLFSVVLHKGGPVSAVVPGFDIGKPRFTNGAGDTYNAGFMLAHSALTALEQHRLQGETPAITLEDCLVFASALTAARLDKADFVTYRELIRFAQEAACRYATHPDDYGWVTAMNLRMLQLRRLSGVCEIADYRDVAVDDSAPLMNRLSAVSELAYREDDAALRQLTNVNNTTVAVNALFALRRYKQYRDRRIVFFDLDGTLFNSSATREMAGCAAIRELSLGTDDDSRLGMFKCIYEDAALYAKLLKQEVGSDFRQSWGTSDFFKVLLYCFQVRAFDGAQTVEQHYEIVSSSIRKDPTRLKKWIKACENSRVDGAVRVFGEYPFFPWSDARSVIKSLKYDLDMEVYMISEGNEACQLWKLQKLGLGDLFAVSPAAGGDEGGRAEQHYPKLVSRMSLFDKAFPNPGEVINRAREEAKQLGILASEKQNIRRVEKVLKSVSASKRQDFHSLAVASVLIFPDDPRGKFTQLAEPGGSYEREIAAGPARIAVIGDRPDIDASPFKAVNKRIWTIRLRKGHHADCPSPHARSGPIVDCEVHSLSEALVHLARRQEWEPYHPVGLEELSTHKFSTTENDTKALRSIMLGTRLPVLKEIVSILLDTLHG